MDYDETTPPNNTAGSLKQVAGDQGHQAELAQDKVQHILPRWQKWTMQQRRRLTTSPAQRLAEGAIGGKPLHQAQSNVLLREAAEVSNIQTLWACATGTKG